MDATTLDNALAIVQAALGVSEPDETAEARAMIVVVLSVTVAVALVLFNDDSRSR